MQQSSKITSMFTILQTDRFTSLAIFSTNIKKPNLTVGIGEGIAPEDLSKLIMFCPTHISIKKLCSVLHQRTATHLLCFDHGADLLLVFVHLHVPWFWMLTQKTAGFCYSGRKGNPRKRQFCSVTMRST